MEFQPQKLLAGLLVLLLFLGAFSSVYQVPANSEAVVQRFGAFKGIKSPGLQFKLPFGIDEFTLVEVQRQQKLEFGFGTRGASNEWQFTEDRYGQDSEKDMVTGDLNSATVEWVVQFHISDSFNYVFKFKDPQKTLRDLAEAAMREVVGDRTVDEVLTFGRQEMEAAAMERLKQLLTKLEMGVHIDQVQLRNVNPPPPVQASFDEVNKAQQEREQLINTANGEYNKVIPRASGEAEQKISAAEGYATKRVNEAEGDATRFNALLAEFKKAPEATRKRIYLETMAEVLPAIPGKIILDEDAPHFLPLMQLRQNNPALMQTPPGQ